MSFEDTHTGKLIHKLGKLISNKLESCLKYVVFLGCFESVHKYSHIAVK